MRPRRLDVQFSAFTWEIEVSLQGLDHSTLFWLPAPSKTFAEDLKLVFGSSAPAREVRRMSSCRLNSSQLRRLAATVDDVGRTDVGRAALSDFRSLRVGLVGNRTLNFLADCVKGSGFRHGLSIDLEMGAYGSLFQSVFDPNGGFLQKLDALVLMLDAGGLQGPAQLLDATAHQTAVHTARKLIESMLIAARERYQCPVVLSTIVCDPEDIQSGGDIVFYGSARRFVDDINAEIAELAREGLCFVWDLDHLATLVGRLQWCDPISRHVAKSPFAIALAPLVADSLCSTLAGLFGKARRGLILDLDNTLWSGVIGDDGPAGIILGQGDAVGEAHLGLQRYALELRRRGVVLAVCSKNDDAVAREPFRNHPEMLIREDHIAVFQANWNDKASNINSIAKTLGLGLDAFVFVDDNPAERARVRQELPEVAVPELPDDPAWYVAYLSGGRYFENARLNSEDLDRARSYQDNARRAEMLSQIGNYDDYLRSLEMSLVISEFDEVGKSRIAQLLSKSNQFNLTTRRYQVQDIDRIREDSESIGLQFRLLDVFGDNGMISVVVLKRHKSFAYIDLWLMSCRVLKRGVEQAVLQEIARCAEKMGVAHIIGEYIPTQRNGMVQDHYERLGFIRLDPSSLTFDDNYVPTGEIWGVDLDHIPAYTNTLRIVRSDDGAED